jgi:hypothetical protein
MTNSIVQGFIIGLAQGCGWATVALFLYWADLMPWMGKIAQCVVATSG